MYHESDGKKKLFYINELVFIPEYAGNKKIKQAKLIKKYIWRILEK